MCTNVVNKGSVSETVIMEVKRNELRRKSYAREFKLTVVTWFHEDGKNVHQTSQHFNLDRKQVRSWVKTEETNQETEVECSDEEDDDEVLTECEEVVDDNESDSEGDSDSDSN